MRRFIALSSVVGLFALSAVAAGCSEKIIVVHEPGSNAPIQPTNGEENDDAPDEPIATPVSNTNSATEGDWGIRSRPPQEDYRRVVQKVGSMASDGDLRRRVSARNLSLVNVMWEDTGRFQGSAIGPNISDLTLQVRERNGGRFISTLMPVIRPPNFSDRTGDVPADKFFVRVGNERSGSLQSVPLTDVLRDIRSFVSVPESILGSGNLLATRDSHLLVSAQAVFLPIPKSGKAEFNPVIFNYQSAPSSPAVLSILVTRQGTSISVVENRGEDASEGGRGQELYFNNHGQRAAFTAERKSDVEAKIEAKGGPTTEDEKSALQKGADVLFLVQVPLVHEMRRREAPVAMGLGGGGMMAPSPKKAAPSAPMAEASRASDVEQAVLGHGPNLGRYNEGRNLRLVRDTRFPVRVTVQFYKATSNGVVSDFDLDSISRSIGSVYEHADFVGSLVLPEGDPKRPTAWQKTPREWFPW